MSKEKQQTAVEWLIQELGEYFPHEIGGIEMMVNKAKEMEKDQLKCAYLSGVHDGMSEDVKFVDCRKYYNETYGK